MSSSIRTLNAKTYGLKASDPRGMSLVILLLVGVSAVAGYVPARRATRVNPITALRDE